MAYYIVAHYSVTDPDTFQKYPPQATAIVHQYGGTFLAVTGPGMQETKVVEGPQQHPATVLIEFESEAAADRWYNSPEYQAVVGLRTDSTDGWLIGLPGFQPPSND